MNNIILHFILTILGIALFTKVMLKLVGDDIKKGPSISENDRFVPNEYSYWDDGWF